MKMQGLVLMGLMAALLTAGGCFGDAKSIQITYQRPAEYDIPAAIKRVAIAEFGGSTALDKKFGDMAADRLASELDAYNRKFNRYQLVDRKRLGEIMKEKDLQIAISDTASASQAGKVADVHAMIYGTVSTVQKEDTGYRTSINPLSRGATQTPYKKLYCMATVNFTMDDISTAKTLTTVTVVREYDSEKPKAGQSALSGVGKAIGIGGSSVPASEQVLSGLVDECVAEFLAKISPHEVIVKEKLENGKGQSVKNGNAYAVAGEYAEALRVYDAAAAENPSDHGAMFNAGLMHEALGRFTEAEGMYDRAIKANPKADVRYINARKRVRGEAAGN